MNVLVANEQHIRKSYINDSVFYWCQKSALLTIYLEIT